MIWGLAFGLLLSSFIAWLMGIPPTLAVMGIVLYPQMVLSLCVIVFLLVVRTINNGGPPTRPV